MSLLSSPLSSLPPARAHRHYLAVKGVLLAFLLALGCVTYGYAASADSRPAADRSAHRAAPVAAAADPVPGTGADPVAADEAPLTGNRSPGQAATTISYDDPIQGGLSVHGAQARSAAVIARHRDVAVAAGTPTWTPQMGRTALERARSWLGMPYSWAGGSADGPTAGRCVPGGGELDCHIVGFDCSGLMMYAWGAYAALPHLASSQLEAGRFHPAIADLRPGDMVFFAGYLPDGVGHVAIYEGDGIVIEAPQSGGVVQRASLADLSTALGYRGAVRPLTGDTPVVTGVTAARAGAPVTLTGTGLADVASVRVGDHTVRQFLRQGDTSLSFRMPAGTAGRHALTVRTTWAAESEPLPVAVSPKAAPRTAPRTKPTSAPSTRSTTATTPAPKPAPTRTSTPTPKPRPSSGSPTSSAPSSAPASTTAADTTAPDTTASSAATTTPPGD